MYKFYNDLDYLFVLKEDKREDPKELFESFYMRKEKEKSFICFNWDMQYDNSSVMICKDFYSKLQYMLASLHEDTYISEVVGDLIGVCDIKVNTSRYVNGDNLKLWQKELGFTYEDFLMNKKYIVISDSDHHSVDKLIDRGFFNWDNIDAAFGNRYIYRNGDFEEGR